MPGELQRLVHAERVRGTARPSCRSARAPRGHAAPRRSAASRRSRRPRSRLRRLRPNSSTVPGVRRQQPEQHVDGGGLARAVRAEQRDGLAGRDRRCRPRARRGRGPAGDLKDLVRPVAAASRGSGRSGCLSSSWRPDCRRTDRTDRGHAAPRRVTRSRRSPRSARVGQRDATPPPTTRRDDLPEQLRVRREKYDRLMADPAARAVPRRRRRARTRSREVRAAHPDLARRHRDRRDGRRDRPGDLRPQHRQALLRARCARAGTNCR